MTNKAPSMMMPALIAGGSLGILNALPYDSCCLWLGGLVNCGCCLWAAGAGFLAAFLYSKNCRKAGCSFGTREGLLAGLLSGTVFGVSASTIKSVTEFFRGGFDKDALRQGVQEAKDAFPGLMDPDTADQVSQFFESVGPTFFILVFALIWILSGVIFGTLGGLIGGSTFKTEDASTDAGDGGTSSPPPAPPVGDATPPPPPVDPSA